MVLKGLVFVVLVASSQALPVLVASNALAETGASSQYKTEDNLGNYAFGYSEDHSSGGSFRKEAGDTLGNKVGSYGLHDADGRARVVNYVADSAGFRADVHTNEPGVDPTQDPADVTVNKAPAVIAKTSTLLAAAPVVAHSHVRPTVTVLQKSFYHVHAPLTLGSIFFHGPSVIL
ncbi:cuticle protein 14 isoform a [Caerostris darwini]|uniref:Cuticle protein 14 isoform a n=1 Tax=Caerostris darwini TaxID=1538125 RepID=A0AAV4S0L4_9ARAC|nr:cuticle protein 14 isoform a [Caerostris darwini]